MRVFSGGFGGATGLSAAGAETVVGHLWRVDDEAARVFFRSFYEELARGCSPARPN